MDDRKQGGGGSEVRPQQHRLTGGCPKEGSGPQGWVESLLQEGLWEEVRFQWSLHPGFLISQDAAGKWVSKRRYSGQAGQVARASDSLLTLRSSNTWEAVGWRFTGQAFSGVPASMCGTEEQRGCWCTLPRREHSPTAVLVSARVTYLGLKTKDTGLKCAHGTALLVHFFGGWGTGKKSAPLVWN